MKYSPRNKKSLDNLLGGGRLTVISISLVEVFMQKKVMMAGIILLSLIALVGCQPKYQFIPMPPGILNPSDNGTESSYTVTINYNQDGVDNIVLPEQNTLTKPTDPTWDEDHEFGFWTVDGVKIEKSDWDSELTGDVMLEANWIMVYDGLEDVPEIAGKIQGDGIGFASENTTEIDFDGEGLVKIRKWQDMNTHADLTLKNIIFDNGLSIHAKNPSGTAITITLEGCEIHWCNQENFKDTSDRPGRIDNSGDGLCLGIDSAFSSKPEDKENENRGDVSIIVRNNHLVGDNNPEADRNGYETLDDIDNPDGRGRWKSRGNGVSLGLQSGGTLFLKSALIEGNTFTGLRGHAIQLYIITNGTTVDIKNNVFESWGINKNNLNRDPKIEDYAIRGDLNAENPGDVNLSGNTYADVVNGNFDVSNRKVKLDNWNGIIQ